MSQIIFYEKPGCINNTRQKKLLRQAGHSVVAKSLLSADWSDDPTELNAFFEGIPVAQWFNASAPAIKQGTVKPDSLNQQQALSLMLEDALLIRRPLMQVGDKKMAGFNEFDVDKWIGLSVKSTSNDLESCPQINKQDCTHD